MTRDVRYAVRRLRREPAFTAAAWVTLGVGVATVATIYAVVHSVLIRLLPVRDERSLAVVYTTETGVHDDGHASYP